MPSLKRVLATCGNAWGGRLGHGITESLSFPRIVGSLVGYDIKAVSCGGAHTACVTDDGTLLTFGINDRGQLGHSEEDKAVPVPIEVGLPDPVVSVAAGEHHTLCLTKAGEVWAWGSNESGQLGLGVTDKLRIKEPRMVKELSGKGVTSLAAGAEHSLALTGAGEVWTWGSGGVGALGQGETGREVSWTPRRVVGPLAASRATSISAGPYSSGAVDASHRAWTWGQGSYWNIGHPGQATNVYAPQQVQGLTNVESLSLSQMSGWAVKRDGRAYCWGTDDTGTLAQGEGHWQRVPLMSPQEHRLLPPLKSISAGWKHVGAVTREGHLLTWGWAGAYGVDAFGTDGGLGQLGHGDERDKWAPVMVQRVHTNALRFYDLRMSYIKPWKVLQVSCGRNHTAMIIQLELDMRDVV